MAQQYETIAIDLFDNTEGVDTCCSCRAFGQSWIYCPIFNHIMENANIKFDETGENNRCELFLKSYNQALDSDTKSNGDPDNNPRRNVDIFHAPIL